MMAVYELYEITSQYMIIKFDESIAVATLKNENFTLNDVTLATPGSPVANPFEPIVIMRDWISINRSLTLWWNFALQQDTHYQLKVSNLKTAFGSMIPTFYIDFVVDDEILVVNPGDPSPGGGTAPISPPGDAGGVSDVDAVDIEDWTIKHPPSIPLPGYTIDTDDDTEDVGATPSDPDIEIVSVFPEGDDVWYLEPDDSEGKIAVQFNVMPAANFITSSDFRLQKKKVDGISRWEDVDTIVAAEPIYKRVKIYLPSDDATPIYSFQTSEPHNWWEPGYVYRLIINPDVGI